MKPQAMTKVIIGSQNFSIGLDPRIRDAVMRAEEEIMGCPLLQKAMAKVEEEALGKSSQGGLPGVPEEPPQGRDFGCQVSK